MRLTLDGARAHAQQILADPENKTPELFRYNAPAPHRLQKMENVGRALDAIKRTGLKLTNIGAEGLSFPLFFKHTHAREREREREARC